MQGVQDVKKVLHVTIFALSIILCGCSVKQEIHSSKPYLITIKTPQMAFSDAGFLNQGNNYTQLQIFSAGTLLLNLEMSESVCLDGSCLNKLSFNKRFFGTEHYESILNDIVHKKPLFNGVNYLKTATGFSQEIDSKEASIVYKVEGDIRFFKDTKNGVLIRLKPLP